MTALARGDFGQSVTYNSPVMSIVEKALPWTVFLMALSLFITFLLAVSLGAVMAYREQSTFDVASTMGFTVLSSVPYYVAGILMLYVLAYQFSLFPTGGRVDPDAPVGFNATFILSALHHAALPMISLVVTEFAGRAVAMRGNSIRVLGEDYLRVARLRGLPESGIALRYVARNAILPMYTDLMVQIGFVFGGAVILEQIFTYRGVGFYMFKAVMSRDYPLMMGAFILITVAVVIAIYVADLTYGKIDPRAETGGESRETY